MDNSLHSFTPFADLPVQARALFFIYASAAMARLGVQRPTPTELDSQLETIWDRHRLRCKDLADPQRLTAIVKKELTFAEQSRTSGRTQ
jgi:hypothetical protein